MNYCIVTAQTDLQFTLFTLSTLFSICYCYSEGREALHCAAYREKGGEGERAAVAFFLSLSHSFCISFLASLPPFLLTFLPPLPSSPF